MGLVQRFISGLGDPINLITRIIVLLFALSLHEAAHAYAAYINGDNTAKAQGRLTMNPFKHLDIFGTISMLLFRFGWAKPVPINPNNFRNQKKGIIMTSLAGVTMNLLMAFVACFLYVLYTHFGNPVFILGEGSTVSYFITTLLLNAMFMNASLCVFNLLPIPPLDGYHIFKELTIKYIPLRFFWNYERYGSIILIVLLVAGVISMILSPAVNGILSLFLRLFYLIF